MMALKCVVLSAHASTLHAYEHDGNRLAGTARNALELLRIFEGHPSLKGGRESFNLNKELKNHGLGIRRGGNGMKQLWSDQEAATNRASCTVSNKRGGRRKLSGRRLSPRSPRLVVRLIIMIAVARSSVLSRLQLILEF